MWIFRAMRMSCGRTMELMAKQSPIRLQMGVTWHLETGRQMATCGSWKTSESRTRASICAITAHEELPSSFRTGFGLSIESSSEQRRLQSRSPRSRWAVGPGRKFVQILDQKYRDPVCQGWDG